MTTGLLLSGGMDSIAIAFWTRPKFAITIDYGQLPAQGEILAATTIAELLSIEHYVIRADLRALGSGDMAGTASLKVSPVPEWWPFRNQMLITLAAMKVLPLGADRLQIGTLASDAAHADGRKEFIDAMDAVLKVQEGGLNLEAPAIKMTSVELIRESKVPLEILAWAHSCHQAIHACGECRGCRKHYETMAALGVGAY